MRNHERYTTNEDTDTLRTTEELLEFGETLPKYVQNYWQNACKTMEPERINGLTDTLVAIKDKDFEQAKNILKENWMDDGLVMGSVATYLPEGVDVVRQVHIDAYGGIKKENREFFDRMEKWHEEQRKKFAKEMGKAAVKTRGDSDNSMKDSEAYHGPTTREKFMERVEDNFGIWAARNMAYGMRMNGKRYGAYGIANCFGYERDEPKKIPNLEQWAKESYNHDLNINKRNFKRFLKKAREDGNKEWVGIFEEWVDKIDKYFAKPNANPSYGNAGFPETMQEQEGGRFMYGWDVQTAFERKVGSYKGYGEVEARLYMCPRTDNLTDFIDEFKDRCNEKDLRYYFKYANYSNRDDRFIIYTNYNLINDHLKTLREMWSERPELFKNMNDSCCNPFWGRIDVDGDPYVSHEMGVYFGEEPRRYPRDFEPTNRDEGLDKKGEDPDAVSTFRGYSYSGLRGDIFDIAFKKWTREVYGEKEYRDEDGWRKFKNEVHFDSPSDISWKNAERLEQIFRKELDKADIDPNNMCFDKYPDTPEGPYKRSYYNK
ncbi:hypothetical protein IKF84_00680 [Candidatus Saccharibacteria bacterium]|nr:hypothetical protein [Candidatus Saccharibacteria bacterium]